MTRKGAVTTLCLVGLTACAAPSEIMVRASDGATVRCSAVGGGLIGASAALVSNAGCVQDFRDMGYVTLDEYKASGADNAPFSVISKDGGYSLSLNSEWKQRPAPERIKNLPGTVFAGNPSKDAYFIITTEANQDISNLSSYLSKYITDLSTQMDAAKTSAVEELTINGRPAQRFETSGTLKTGFNVHYLFTVIQSDKRLIKINAWTAESKFASTKADLEKLAYAVNVLSN